MSDNLYRKSAEMPPCDCDCHKPKPFPWKSLLKISAAMGWSVAGLFSVVAFISASYISCVQDHQAERDTELRSSPGWAEEHEPCRDTLVAKETKCRLDQVVELSGNQAACRCVKARNEP